MFKDLSPRAQQMLLRENRYTGRPKTIDQVQMLTNKEGCPLDHPIVNYQLDFGGYWYRPYRSKRYKVWLGLNLNDPYIIEWNGHWLCEILDSNYIQTYFMMAENGIIYDGQRDIYYPIASSVNFFFENEAMKEAQAEITKNWYISWFRISSSSFGDFSNKISAFDLQVLEEASDVYTHWWASHKVIVQKEIDHYDASIAKLRVYAKHLQELKEIQAVIEHFVLEEKYPQLNMGIGLLTEDGIKRLEEKSL